MVDEKERDYGTIAGGNPLGNGYAITGAYTEPDENGGEVLYINGVDLGNDTVTSSHLEEGYTAHDANGNSITGTLSRDTTPESPIDLNIFHQTRVYDLTHDSNGGPRGFIERSFISFSYGDEHERKNIEDFSLVVTMDGSGMQRNAYADFSDNVTQSDVWDGQIFWNSHFNNNSISFSLATDGMTQRQLDDFKRWFKPGVMRELIVSEHPNRAILARVSAPPQIQMVPFETPQIVTLGYSKNGDDYSPWQSDPNSPIGGPVRPSATYTTLYKGTINIDFVMDEPFWYSVANIVNPISNRYYNEDSSNPNDKPENPWITIDSDKYNKVNADGEGDHAGTASAIIAGEKMLDWRNPNSPIKVAITNYDAWKTIHEDYIPTIDMIPPTTAVAFGTKESLTVDMSKSIKGSLVGYARVGDDNPVVEGGHTAYWENESTGIDLFPVTIEEGSFENMTVINEWTGDSWNDFKNNIIEQFPNWNVSADTWDKIYNIYETILPNSGYQKACSTCFTHMTEGYLYYSGTAPSRPVITFAITPQFYDGYIIVPYNPIKPYEEYYNKTYNSFVVQGPTKTQAFQFTTPSVYTGYNQVIRIFKQFAALKNPGAWEEVRVALRDNVKHWAPRAYALWLIDKVRRDNTTAVASDLELCINYMRCFLDTNNLRNSGGSYGYDNPDTYDVGRMVVQIDCKTGQATGMVYYRTINDKTQAGKLDVHVENIGDMVRSNYLTLDERNSPDENGMIQSWSEENPYCSYRFYTDCPMENVYFQYSYMYY